MMDHSQIKILLVDDEPAICRSLVGFLEDNDFPTDSALSAEEALEMLAVKTYDILIADLRLPGVSGEVLILKAHEINPKVRCLVNTGSVEYTLSEDLKQIGMKPEHVFLKPLIDMQTLITGIEKLSEGKD